MSDEGKSAIDGAISALMQLAASDRANRAHYGQKINELTRRKADNCWNEIRARTQALLDAASILEDAIGIATRGGSPSALASVRRAIDGIRKLVPLDGGAAAPGAPGSTRGAARSRRSFGGASPAVHGGTDGLRKLRVVCVHGVGDHRDGAWKLSWLDSMQAAVRHWNAAVVVEPIWCEYDDIVEEYGVGAGDYAEAIASLAFSGIVHGIGDLIRARRARGELSNSARWTVGMVAQWAANERFRKACCDRVLQVVREATAAEPVHAVLAHSLGSLVSYDAFRADPRTTNGVHLVTLGSQIGSPFVRSRIGGALRPIDPASQWWHLYNEHDHAFAEPIRLSTDNFMQVETPFDLRSDLLNHDAVAYLGHQATSEYVWEVLVGQAESGQTRGRRSIGTPAARAIRTGKRVARASDRRALLIGINEYPNVEDRLGGCVNDVFTMSAVLQEMQRADMRFRPADIRVVLDGRATAQGIRERLEWLFEDVRPGDTRLLYYSGHGAQMASYGANGEPDHFDECLVPWDFKWSKETAITDDDLYNLYANLPYDPESTARDANAQVVMILDCCHSGGLARGGAAPIARGLTPPDDIRHRALEWNAGENMWVPRGFGKQHGSGRGVQIDVRGPRAESRRSELVGSGSLTHRIGAAVPLRAHALERRSSGKAGAIAPGVRPFMPLILQACKENQYAYEYKHGVESHGAFTWSLASLLRKHRMKGGASMKQLVSEAGAQLKKLDYDQRPELRGPTHMKNARFV